MRIKSVRTLLERLSVDILYQGIAVLMSGGARGRCAHRAGRALGKVLLLSSACAVFGGPAARAADFSDPQWVSFHAAAATPSALARRVLGKAINSARPSAGLRGLLVVPEGEGPFPAVVLLHGCRGVLPSQKGWAQWLARQGFVALLVDSFLTRNAVNVCRRGPDDGASQAVGGRVFDAFGALQYLRADARVDPQRIAVIGWQSSAPLSAVASSGPRLLVEGAFRAAVAISPQCPLRADESAVPVLIVIGEKDQWHSARACKQLLGNSGGALQLVILPGVGHGFDEVPARGGLFASMAFNAQLGHVVQVPLRYDGHAHERAAQSILQFLRRELLGDGRASGSVSDPLRLPIGARWAVDPARPGADRPLRGHSLFDRVFANGQGGHRIPEPFSKVLDALEHAIGVPTGSREGLATALIPIGRSLQRSAAAPDFFRFPRLVVAVDGEPVNGPRRHFLKDRMFLGYHEKAAVIEVISYNEQAARFEYQIVDNYRPGSEPQVRYANRALCVSCHQNQAPIFSRAAWDETNANRHTARRLRAQREQFYGVTVQAGGALAARIDNATDRANLLPALQWLWREACGAADAGAARCRAAALVAMVQYRFSAAAGYEQDDPIYLQQFVAPFERHWARLAPGGLAIPEADLLNRDPLLEPLPTEIDAHLDPLAARAPAAIWDLKQAMRRLISELAQSLPQADLSALDTQLSATAQRELAPRREVVLPCTVTSGGRAHQSELIQVRCGDALRGTRQPAWLPADAQGGLTASTAAGLAVTAASAAELQMELNIVAGQVADGLVSHITLPGGDRFERIYVSQAALKVDAHDRSQLVAQLRQRNGWSVRNRRGHALEQIELRWATDKASDTRSHEGTLRLQVVEDFAPVRSAVQSIITDADSVHDTPFGDGSFIPTQVLSGIVHSLDANARHWCCDVRELPVIALEASAQKTELPGVSSADDHSIVVAFRRHCGACHAADSVVPPGFLHGSEAQVMASIRQCAPRIAFRLGMWLRAADDRSRSPMPPPTILPSRGLDEMSWRNSIAFDRLLRWADSHDGLSAVIGNASVAPAGLAKCLPGLARTAVVK